jgi:AraC-like DNA-binding protein
MHCEASPGNGAGGGVSNLRWGARVKRIYGAAGFDTNGRPDTAVGSRRARDPGEATAIVSDIYLPNRLVLPRGVSEVDMELRGYELGAVTVGRLEYGKNLLQVTGDCQNFHVTMPLHGRALSTHGGGDVVPTIAGQCLIFSPGAPAELRWSFDCVQLCVMLSRHAVEHELERLLGTRPNNMLRFDFGARARENLGQRWRTMLRLLIEEIEHPTGIMASTPVGRHMEAMLIDGLLLAHPHNHSDALLRPAAPGASVTVRRAVDLMESQPGEAWSVVRLAGALNVSVRALQDGFRRDLGVPPMRYLKRARLNRARSILRDASPHEVTVRAVGKQVGLLHPGRFAAEYRATFGEDPSATLRRGR